MIKKRLDEILLHEGLVTEDEIRQALLRRKEHGGRFGSQLLSCGYIDESQLVRALSIQLDCPGVVISEVEIPDSVVNMIPEKVALARSVIPFEYDAEAPSLKIACHDPSDWNLIRELSFVAAGAEIELYVAAEIPLKTVIAKRYLGRDCPLGDDLPPETLEEPVTTCDQARADHSSDELERLLLSNLELMSSLLSSTAGVPQNHSKQVGEYAERLCRRLDLAPTDRLLITSAGYLHNLARFYYKTVRTDDSRRLIQLTIKLLVSLNYSPVLIDILHAMYTNLDKLNDAHPTIEVLGGNILTVVDLFCHAVPDDERLSLDTFDAVKKNLREQVGRQFLLSVVETFIEMVQDEILNLEAAGRSLQLMLYCEDPIVKHPLELRLKDEGFGIVSHDSVTSLARLYERSKPDILILAVMGDAEKATTLVDDLTTCGIKIVHTPTLLLAERSSVSHLTGLLERGVEDIIVLEDNLDLLVDKIRNLGLELGSETVAEEMKSGPAASASGRLADSNLIDLLQDLDSGRKTARITVESGKHRSDRLTLYVDGGNLVVARLKDLKGPEALYEGLTWADGTWSIEPVETEEIPPRNISLSNEAILMEGCRLLDERLKCSRQL
jgi:DNA-binding NarL/FixJ family response regulator